MAPSNPDTNLSRRLSLAGYAFLFIAAILMFAFNLGEHSGPVTQGIINCNRVILLIWVLGVAVSFTLALQPKLAFRCGLGRPMIFAVFLVMPIAFTALATWIGPC